MCWSEAQIWNLIFACFCTAGVWQCSHETLPRSVLETVVADARRIYPTVWWLCLGWEIVPAFTSRVPAFKWLFHLFPSLTFSLYPLVNQTQLSRLWDMLLFLQDWSHYQRWTEGLFNTFQAIPGGKTGFFSFQMFFFSFAPFNTCIIPITCLVLLAACLIDQPCNYDVTRVGCWISLMIIAMSNISLPSYLTSIFLSANVFWCNGHSVKTGGSERRHTGSAESFLTAAFCQQLACICCCPDEPYEEANVSSCSS